MGKTRPAKKSGASLEKADPRFFPVAKAFGRIRGFSLMESKSGALRGLVLNGKSFGMSSNGRFVLKLTEERAQALVAEGVGQPFRPGPGRVMKGWIEVTAPDADWVTLAREAYRLAAAKAPAGKKSKG
jgi:hypothetical protein